MTVKELMNKLNPHFDDDCEVLYFYQNEMIDTNNIKIFENKIIKNYFIVPWNSWKISVDIE